MSELLIFSADAAHGAHDAHFNLFELGSTMTNLMIFVAFLVFALRKPVALALAARREELGKRLREAQAKYLEAETKLKDFGHKLDHLEDEMARIVQSFEAQGKADRERLIADTDRAVDRLVREADFTIRQESLKAQNAVREAGIESTVRMAESMIREKITDADRRRLADDYITQLEQQGS